LKEAEPASERGVSGIMTNAQALSIITLTEGWQFRQTDDTAEDAWMSVKRVPTNVHLDLMEHGKYVSPGRWNTQYQVDR
jgi:beta-mannosidase